METEPRVFSNQRFRPSGSSRSQGPRDIRPSVCRRFASPSRSCVSRRIKLDAVLPCAALEGFQERPGDAVAALLRTTYISLISPIPGAKPRNAATPLARLPAYATRMSSDRSSRRQVDITMPWLSACGSVAAQAEAAIRATVARQRMTPADISQRDSIRELWIISPRSTARSTLRDLIEP